MTMDRSINRLKSDEMIGQAHIAVQRHEVTSYCQHWHNYFEIEIIVAGTGVHYFNGAVYPISKGDVFMLTPVDFHQVEAAEPLELINISFDEVWLSETMRTILYTTEFSKRQRFAQQDYERLVMVAELLQHECESNGSCITQLLEYLLSRFIPHEMLRDKAAENQIHLSGIKKAVAYIELHFREKVTLQQLSAISGYNPTYFSKLFRKFTGQTYIERLTSLRINYAKALLARGLSVSDACYESGFGSLSNFLSVFKASCGVPPSEYRKIHK